MKNKYNKPILASIFLPLFLLFSGYKSLVVSEQGLKSSHLDILNTSTYSLLNGIVERHDYSKIVDLTFPALDTEAGKLVAVLQQKYGSSISNFKIYEFGMYAPSVYAGKSLEFEQAFSDFDAQYSGASGDPYLLIARQLQGSGISMRFKVKLKLPFQAPLTVAAQATLESDFAEICEDAIDDAYSGTSALVGLAEAAGIEKLTKILNNWSPGQTLPQDNLDELLDAKGFSAFPVACQGIELDPSQVSSNRSVQDYAGVLIPTQVGTPGANRPNLRSGKMKMADFLDQQADALAQSMGLLPGMNVQFILTSDNNYGTSDWSAAESTFNQHSGFTLWLNFSAELKDGKLVCKEVFVGGELNATDAEIDQILQEKKDKYTSQGNEQIAKIPWSAHDNWLFKKNGADFAYNYQPVFGFGVTCGVIDAVIEQFNLIAFLGQLAVEAGKYIFATHCENIATSLNFIADYILYSSALEKKLKLTAEKINRQAKKIKADLQLINGLWETLKNFDPVTFVKEFVEDLKKTFGIIFGPDDRERGYTIGKAIGDLVIEWVTAGVGKATNVLFKRFGDAIRNGPKGIKSTIDDAIVGNETRKSNCRSLLGCFVAGTLVSTPLGGIPIEQFNPEPPVRLEASTSFSLAAGDKFSKSLVVDQGVWAYAPPAQDSSDWIDIDYETEITPENWRWLKFAYTKPDSSISQVYLRRPLWWMDKHQANQSGDQVFLSLPDMGIRGLGRLEAIFPSYLDTRLVPVQREGDFVVQAITGFFTHESTDVWDFYFSELEEPISCTYNHPFYSLDRHKYIAAGELAIGERIKSRDDSSAKFLLKKFSKEKCGWVYNIEVWREHNYLIGERQFLVHNGCFYIPDLDEWVKKPLIWMIKFEQRGKPYKYKGKLHNYEDYYDEYGFPDFSKYAVKSYTFEFDELTGESVSDFKLVNEKVFGKKSYNAHEQDYKDYTWHHHQNGRTLFLIPKELNSNVKHTGGAAVIRYNKAQGKNGNKIYFP